MDTQVSFRGLWTFLIVGLFLFGDYSCACAAGGHGCNGELYKDPSFSHPERSFSVFDKVYLRITCNDLPAGSYTVVSDWINPQGKLVRQNTHDFEVKETTAYMSYSWMKLLRNGPLQRNLTGRDVDIDHYGEWTVKAYLFGQEVEVKKFTLY